MVAPVATAPASGLNNRRDTLGQTLLGPALCASGPIPAQILGQVHEFWAS